RGVVEDIEAVTPTRVVHNGPRSVGLDRSRDDVVEPTVESFGIKPRADHQHGLIGAITSNRAVAVINNSTTHVNKLGVGDDRGANFSVGGAGPHHHLFSVNSELASML